MKSDIKEYLESEIQKDPSLRERLKKASVAIDVSTQIYNLRKLRGYTQQQLADKLGVSQSNIARLEDNDYEGHSLKSLSKVADALDAIPVSLLPREEATIVSVKLVSDIRPSVEEIIISDDSPSSNVQTNSARSESFSWGIL